MDLNKLAKYVMHFCFGGLLLWMSYVYYLYRFKVSIVIDDEVLAQDSQLGQVISYVIATIVAVVAKEIGTPAANLVRKTLEVASHAFAIRFVPNELDEQLVDEVEDSPVSTPDTERSRSPVEAQ